MDLELELLSAPSPGPRAVANDRRSRDRVPVRLTCDEYVGDKMHRALTANVSPTGLYVDRVFGAGLDRLQPGREARQVQLEFTLPSTSESIWALGEICHDSIETVRTPHTTVRGTGVRFVAIARRHERMIEEFVTEQRRICLERLLERVRNRRRSDRRRHDRRAA